MALKLFRSTGYSSILGPGETRVGTHPGWPILLLSVWIGFACNVALWRELRSIGEGPGLPRSLLAGVFLSATAFSILSLFGWRRTLKHVATLLLLLAALAASGIWVQQLALDSSLLAHSLRTLVVPSWPSLLRWQFPVLVVALGLPPMLWVWQLQIRRLSGPDQFASNMAGVLAGIVLMAGTGWFLFSPG